MAQVVAGGFAEALDRFGESNAGRADVFRRESGKGKIGDRREERHAVEVRSPKPSGRTGVADLTSFAGSQARSGSRITCPALGARRREKEAKIPRRKRYLEPTPGQAESVPRMNHAELFAANCRNDRSGSNASGSF